MLTFDIIGSQWAIIAILHPEQKSLFTLLDVPGVSVEPTHDQHS